MIDIEPKRCFLLLCLIQRCPSEVPSMASHVSYHHGLQDQVLKYTTPFSGSYTHHAIPLGFQRAQIVEIKIPTCCKVPLQRRVGKGLKISELPIYIYLYIYIYMWLLLSCNT